VCAYAVNRSHAELCNIEEAFAEETLEHEVAIAKKSIKPEIWEFEFSCDSIDLCVRFENFREEFCRANASQVFREFKWFGSLLRQKVNECNYVEGWLVDLYFALLLVVAALSEADVASVIEAPMADKAAPIDPEDIYEYALGRPKASDLFQALREDAWKQIQDRIHALPKAFRLTLPTGLGKTLMGLYLSAKVQPKNPPRPVIYALPYLSIIEQSASVCREIFENSEVHVVQHHSLSFPDLKKKNAGLGEVPEFEKARFLLEEWDADLVVTTFDQLFYTFLSNDRGFIRRFFKLPGSVLLLDEVQTIPARLIPAVGHFLKMIQARLRGRVVYMTATHPPFLQEIPALVPCENRYFEPLNRTTLRLCLEPVEFSRFLHGLPEWLLERKGKKVLIVANTIRSASEICRYLFARKADDEKFKGLEVHYLSGSVVPIERLERIQEIQEKCRTSRDAWLCVVTTQCVEAGVDLDMDEAIRDFAPWDSLLQVCGRVNRFGKRGCSHVWVYRWVDDEKGKEFHSYIYDRVFADVTLKVLEHRGAVSEGEYLKVHHEYVEALQRRLSTEKSDEMLKAALAWDFGELDFQKLFREADVAWKVSVFCVADETAERLRDIAIALWEEKDPIRALDLTSKLCESPLFGRLGRFLRQDGERLRKFAERIKCASDKRQLRFNVGRLLRPLFQAYTISIPAQRLSELPLCRMSEDIPYLEREVYKSLICTEPGIRGSMPAWIL
jgi:CRISPR-associated endonuclease/helicase Cas3